MKHDVVNQEQIERTLEFWGKRSGRKPLSAVMCMKVSRLFGGTPEFWMRLQCEYDLKKAAQNKKVMERVARIVPVKLLEEIRR